MPFTRTHENRTCHDLHRLRDHLLSRLEPTRGSALASGDPSNPLFAGIRSVVGPDGADDQAALHAEIAEVERAMFDAGCDIPEYTPQWEPPASTAPPIAPPPMMMSQ